MDKFITFDNKRMFIWIDTFPQIAFKLIDLEDSVNF